MRTIAACLRSMPAGSGIASSPFTLRRWAQFSRCRLMTRSPFLTCFTAAPTAATRPTHSAPGVAGNGGFSL